MSDAVTLIAGILLTSVGLVALLPYVMRRGWSRRTGDLAVDSGYTSVLPPVDAFAERPAESLKTGVPAEDLDELLAHLFSLRMTVSEVTAEVQDAHEALRNEGDDAAREDVDAEFATGPVEGVA